MRLVHSSRLVVALLLACGPAQAVELKDTKPENVGFSAERLQRLDKAMQGTVDDKAFAGMVTVLTRHGKIVDLKAYGKQDLDGAAPMQADTIFRCASMTKPVTAVAMMILYEEGKWRPEEPIAKYIPEFADLKVFTGMGVDGKPIVDAPVHAPTIGELMDHTAGFSYGFFPGADPVDKMYVDAKVLQSGSLQEFIEKLAQIPLAYQPGRRWAYSVSVDIQGYLVEKLSGKSLPDFMRERIFEPLGMKDSGFFVPEDKLSRLATLYHGEAGKPGLVASPRPASVSQPPAMPSGGGGLFSTAADYARFATMLSGGGELNGVRILSPSSVRLMGANHLSDFLLAGGEFGFTVAAPNGVVTPNFAKNAFGIGFYRASPGHGYGYDVGVYHDPDRAGRTVGKGTFHWDGAFGTWFWVDPTNDLAFVGMIQRSDLGNIPNVQELSRALVYQALTNPEK